MSKVLGPNKREVDIAKHGATHFEFKSELSEREALATPMIEEAKESGASACDILGQLKATLASRASLLVMKSVLPVLQLLRMGLVLRMIDLLQSGRNRCARDVKISSLRLRTNFRN